MTTLQAGSLAFFDSFSGLVPVTITKVHKDENANNVAIEMRVNATRQAYKRGDVFRTANGRYVVPRSHVRVRYGQYRIFGEWQFQ